MMVVPELDFPGRSCSTAISVMAAMNAPVARSFNKVPSPSFDHFNERSKILWPSSDCFFTKFP